MRILAAMCVFLMCTGCSRQESGYGNLAGVDSVALVQDTLFVMFETYPPAQTRLSLVHKADDAFGKGLVEALRLHGYAVAEYVEQEKKGWNSAQSVKKPDGLPFAYLIAETGTEKEIRVTIHIGDESLSRLYEVAGDGEEVRYVSKGFWSHLEQRGRAPGENAQTMGDS